MAGKCARINELRRKHGGHDQGNVVTLDSIPDHLHYICEAMQTESLGAGILADMEKQAIVEALRKTFGNKVEASRLLGIGLRTLYRKIDKWQL